MPQDLKLLLLEDELFDAELNIASLEAEGYRCTWERVETRHDFLAALKTPDYDIILIDYNLPGFDGMTALKLLQEHDLDIPVLFVTGNLQPELAIDSIKAGALDFVHKDRLTRLAPSVSRALEETQMRRESNARKAALEFSFSINRLANSNASLEVLIGFISKYLPEHLGCDGVSIHIVDQNKEALDIYWYAPSLAKYKQIEKLLGITIPTRLNISLHSDSVYVQALETRKARVIIGRENIEQLFDDYLQAAPFRARIKKTIKPLLPKLVPLVGQEKILLFPMILDGQVIGLLELSYRDKNTKSDSNSIQSILQQITAVLARKAAETKLKKLHAEQELILSSAVEGILGIDMDGRHTFVNPAAADMLGYVPEELIGENGHELYHIKDNEGVALPEDECPVIHGIYASGERIVQGETVFWRKDGTKFPVLYSSSIIRDGGGKVGAVVTFQDITEQVERTRELARLAQIVQQAQTSIVLTDLDATLTYVNSFFEEITGYSKEEALGKNPRILQSGHQDAAFYENMWDTLTKGKAWHDVLINKRKDGSLYYEDANIFPIKTEHGETINYAAVKRDITAEVEAKNALEEEKIFSERVVQTSMAIIVGLDHQRKIRLFNRGAEKSTGYTREEVLGKDWFELFLATEITAEMEVVWQDSWERNESYSYVNPIVIKDGSKKIISWQNAKLFEEVEHEKQMMISIGADITQRVQSEEQVRLQLRQLDALYHIDSTILASMDASFSLHVILDEVRNQLEIDAIALLLYEKDSDELVFAANEGFRSEALLHTRLKTGEGLAGKAVLNRETIHISDLDKSKHFQKVSPDIKKKEGFVAYWGIPLIAKGKIIGVLELFHRTVFAPSGTWEKFMAMLSEQVAVAVYNASLFEGMQKSNRDLRIAYDETLEGWAYALELRDMETEGHSRRVTSLTVELAIAMGIGEPEIEHVRRGALLHDIGKMGIPDAILHKAGPLDDSEWAIMRQHPVYAYEMLREIPFLKPALDIPHHHHERWDGSGYPDGLKGDEIPLPARIFAIIDVYDALANDRPYRAAWSDTEVIEKIRAESGKHFDPAVVDAFFERFSVL